MSIYQVAIDLDHEKYSGDKTNINYQNTATYLTLFVSDWLKALKLNLGDFKRIVFREGQIKYDFTVGGVSALVVCLTEGFLGMDQFRNEEITHQYFKRKYLEGFARFDEKFSLQLTPKLALAIDEYFSEQYAYEKEMKSKRIQGHKYQVVKRYKYDAFDLLLRVIDKRGVRLSETVIFNFVPDPYRVYFNVHKVEINEDCIRVINQNGELTKEFVLERPGLNTVH